MMTKEIAAEVIGSNKRQRTATATTAADDSIHITDLPVGFLVDACSYLPKSSGALFAVAMSAPSSSWQDNNLVYRPSAISKAIAQWQWDALDFGDGFSIGTDNDLSDEDISAALTCIGAKRTLKILKFTGCIKFEGHGLNPLRGSITLEQIDLSLVAEYYQPKYAHMKQGSAVAGTQVPRISETYCLPILESIIDANGCLLKQIQFPEKWRAQQIVTRRYSDFLERLNQFFVNRALECARCQVSLEGHEWIDRRVGGKKWHGTVVGNQCRTCYLSEEFL